MFNKLYDIYTSEWYKIVKPFGVLDKLLQFMHISLPWASNMINSFLAYKYHKVNSAYSFISIPEESIHAVGNHQILGVTGPVEYKYIVKDINDTFYMLGCGFTDNLAFIGVDYIVKDGVYFFKEHPSKYCFAFKHKGKVEYNTIGGVGSKINVLHPNYRQSFGNSEVVATIYDNIMKLAVGNSFNTLSLYQQGIYADKGLSGIVIKLWKDKDYTFAVLDNGGFVAAHKDSNLTLSVDCKPVLRQTLPYFTIELNGIDYPVAMLTNDIKNYPGILQKYPALTVTNGKFIGNELYTILKNQGCSFIEIPYINKYDVDTTLLNQSMHQGIKLMYLGVSPVLTTFACASEAKESSTAQLSDTSFSNTKVEINIY